MKKFAFLRPVVCFLGIGLVVSAIGRSVRMLLGIQAFVPEFLDDVRYLGFAMILSTLLLSGLASARIEKSKNFFYGWFILSLVGLFLKQFWPIPFACSDASSIIIRHLPLTMAVILVLILFTGYLVRFRETLFRPHAIHRSFRLILAPLVLWLIGCLCQLPL